MATHSSVLAWDMPWTEEPGELQSMRLQESRTRLSDYTTMFVYSTWQPTAVFLPGESRGQKSLACCSPWGCKALHTTEATEHQQLCYSFPDHTQLLSSTTCLLIALLAITIHALRHEFLYCLI